MKYKNKSISILSLSFWDQSPRLRNWSNTFEQNGYKVKIFCYESQGISGSNRMNFETISHFKLNFLPSFLKIPIKSLIFSLLILYILVLKCDESQNIMIIVFN